MGSLIKTNADNTKSTDTLSRQALNITDEGTQAVSSMITSMNDINDSSNIIGEISDVINNIAFQTNLLALNASIEAARAGEQGKGFAVVAVEVRKLAKKTDRAASEIGEIIKSSNNKVIQGVQKAKQAGDMLNSVSDSVKQLSELVSNIAASSEEQLININSIDETLTNLDKNTQQNSELVVEAAAATEELSAQAEELNSNIKFFNL